MQYAGSIYVQIAWGSPDINSDNILMVYHKLILQLTEIVEAGEDKNYIDSEDQWEISENLQDGNRTSGCLPLDC